MPSHGGGCRDGFRRRLTVRGVQVPAAEVREGLRLRALLQLRAGGGAVRRHPQGFRRQQRVEAAAARAAGRPLRGGRHHRLRGPGQAEGPCLRLRRPHSRAATSGSPLPRLVLHASMLEHST